MCMKTPKPKEVKEKPVQWLRNPLLDGLRIGGQNTGRASLRNDLGGGAAYINPYMTPPKAAPAAGTGTGLATPTVPNYTGTRPAGAGPSSGGGGGAAGGGGSAISGGRGNYRIH